MPLGFHYRLLRCDDDGAIHGVELDDNQVNFSTRFEPGIGATVGNIEINLSEEQVEIIKAWWIEP